MKFPKFAVHEWISIDLFVLGLAMPAVNVYYHRNESDLYRFLRFLEIYRFYQWLPFTLLFWLGASFAWSEDRIWRVLVLILFVLGMLWSGLSWVYLVGSH